MPRARRSTMGQSSFGEGLRKSFSYEPLAGRHNSSSDEGTQISSSGGVRFERRVTKSTSMSPIKTTSKMSSPSSDESSESEAGTQTHLKPQSDDDVFVDRSPSNFSPADDERKDSRWTKTSEASNSKELALVRPGPARVDPQGIYPPTACIFVANLTQSAPDDKLEAEVTRIFSQFGTVFVKIRRDGRQMPFAFCQFTCDQDARNAEEQGRDIEILRRKCRIEKAKANSAFIVYKDLGPPITEDDAFRLLAPLGNISHVAPLDEEARKGLQIPPAVAIHFRMYDPGRDVLKAVKQHRNFVVIPYDSKMVATPGRLAMTASRSQLAQYEVDRRSAYFGNLPLDMTQEELREMAVSCGQVVKATVNKKPIAGTNAETCFGFVEFHRPDTVEDTVRAYLRGYGVRVQRKQSRSFNTPIRSASRMSSPYQSSAHRSSPGPLSSRQPSSAPRYPEPVPSSSYSTPSGPYGPPARYPPLGSPSPYGGPAMTPTRATPGLAGSDKRASHQMPPIPLPQRRSSARRPVTRPDEDCTLQGTVKTHMRPVHLQRIIESRSQGSEQPKAHATKSKADCNNAETLPVARSNAAPTSGDKTQAEPETRLDLVAGSKAVTKETGEYDADDEDGSNKRSPPKGPRNAANGHRNPPPGPRNPTPLNANTYPLPYMAPHVSPYGYPPMAYPMPGPYTPSLHPAMLNGYMGYPPGLMWADPYCSAVYPGMASGMSAPPFSHTANTPPTPPQPSSSQDDNNFRKEPQRPSEGTPECKPGDGENEKSEN